ncbi:hypothetical protein AGOR_G00120910 [Albula goreensis]|uniref:Keratinocyte differentiation factor 1 n=1 Tax=Albula goreensis TaxID=1534307 RepID=A0A8T3DIS5_9TELE|nr:hypothetical protein AGOR_G00120910 [Albula goreensis]
MPGTSSGRVQKHRPHSAHGGRSGPEGYRRTRTQSRDSSASLESSREPCLDQTQQGSKPRPRSAGSSANASNGNGRDLETLGFIPGSADSGAAVRSCGLCTPRGWGGCRALICCVLTCGLYGTREPCLSARETSTDDPVPEDRPPNGIAMTTPATVVRQEPRASAPTKLPPSDSFRYPDVRIAGKRVVYPEGRSRPAGGGRGGSETQRPVSSTSITSVYSREELDFLDDLSDSGTDIDSLITKKLLELYKLHQIDQLAKCTSDSSFSRKTNEISDLIYSIAQDYNLEEQEAECRLVHGVIRISTRKSKRAPKSKDSAPHATLNSSDRANGRRDGTLPDSGNETMTDTFYSEIPEVKVSQQTPSDELARQMRMGSGRAACSSSSPTAYSPFQQDTETDSSGTPLLHYLRT